MPRKKVVTRIWRSYKITCSKGNDSGFRCQSGYTYPQSMHGAIIPFMYLCHRDIIFIVMEEVDGQECTLQDRLDSNWSNLLLSWLRWDCPQFVPSRCPQFVPSCLQSGQSLSSVQFHTTGESRKDTGISEIQEWQYNRFDGNIRRKEQESPSSESTLSIDWCRIDRANHQRNAQ